MWPAMMIGALHFGQRSASIAAISSTRDRSETPDRPGASQFLESLVARVCSRQREVTPLLGPLPDPSNPAYRLNMQGNALFNRNDYDGAIAAYNDAIYNDPQNFTAYLMRGRARLEKGDYNWAIDDFSKVIDIDPSITAAYYYRSIAFQRMALAERR
jgi:tetratricopeptide (TPR) repeat protein